MADQFLSIPPKAGFNKIEADSGTDPNVAAGVATLKMTSPGGDIDIAGDASLNEIQIGISTGAGLPSQAGHDGEALFTDGSMPYWAFITFSPNLDGGSPTSTYGAVSPISGGSP